MRISLIDSFGGSLPPENPSMKIWPPLGPAAGPASACKSAARSSGLSDNMSISSRRRIKAPALLEGSVLTREISVTVTSCLSEPTCMRISRDAGRPVWTTKSVFSNSVKPLADTLTTYLSGARPLITYSPEIFVLATFTAPCAPVAMTLAFGIAAPEGSVTTPRRTPAPA